MNRKRFFGKYRLAALCVALLCIAAFTFASAKRAGASGDLDYIREYEITVDVNEDGTLTMQYHIAWEVLDSDSEGPLSWVKIGIPNRHYLSVTASGDAVANISDMMSGGTWLRIDLDRDYYKGEVVNIDFSLVQDYMYDMNGLTEGETVYYFTPGWFDDIRVGNRTVRWNCDKAEAWSPACEIEDGYCVWTKPLEKGERFKVQVSYRNDAFGFDSTKEFGGSDASNYDDSGSDTGVDSYSYDLGYGERSGDDGFGAFIAIILFFGFIFIIIGGVVSAANKYTQSSGFGAGETKKILRTRIEYHPSCPGCGAPRPEGRDNCEYCGASFIKKEERIEESDIPAEETAVRAKRTNGLYRYSSSPNTYVRVNVVTIPAPKRSSGNSHRSGGGCAHSSCACACAHSCACACACACAGGGRAGCTVKDFYHTGLTLEAIRRNCK